MSNTNVTVPRAIALMMLDQFKREVGSKDFLHDIMVAFNYTNGSDNFRIRYEKNGGLMELNQAWRSVYSLYDRVRVQNVSGMLQDSDVRSIMEPGSVREFLDKVIPLCEAKPVTSSTVAAQKLFWQRFAK